MRTSVPGFGGADEGEQGEHRRQLGNRERSVDAPTSMAMNEKTASARVTMKAHSMGASQGTLKKLKPWRFYPVPDNLSTGIFSDLRGTRPSRPAFISTGPERPLLRGRTVLETPI
jgi:hypothetical protein